MGKKAIKVNHLSKRYRIGQRAPYNTFRDAIISATKAPSRLFKNSRKVCDSSEYFYALKDVSFEVLRGEVVGIIGRNGAGKSTLLKILSRITTPTEGSVELYGRVGSLLEVGTGFHSELTGRENIYLSGSILGMRKREIDDKFDEIVKFSEIEKFLETPVKRYSSGMYVRLAFAVAAHLDPEILLVDEVLAVGDAAFQRKCLGKMSDVSKEGRTVLFISHNMNAINELCQRAILLDAGKRLLDGSANEIVNAYLSNDIFQTRVDLDNLPHKGPQNYALLKKLVLLNNDRHPTTSFIMKDSFVAQIEVECFKHLRNAEIGLKISSRYGQAIHYLTSTWEGLYCDLEPGRHIFEVQMPEVLLFPGTYQIGLWVSREGEWSDDNVQDVTRFEVFKGDVTGFPTTIDKYVFSGCEVYAPSKWTLLENFEV